MKKHTEQTFEHSYIETPRQKSTTVKLDVILEQRMKDFLLSRRRRRWLNFGD